MASLASRSGLSARLVGQYARKRAVRRGFSTTRHDRAAQNFSMPALSPTMTEGNISKWRVKEGDAYSAGDVLLEIETDKASMDVEAQDDGILFKIMQQDGAKGVKVGERIAVIAEEGDDLSSLELPTDSSKTAQPEKKEQSAPKEETTGVTVSASSSPSESDSKSKFLAGASSSMSSAVQRDVARSHKYPLFPSVQQLLHENNLTKEDADKIQASGPGGRLLKGDVLAHLGKIQKDYPEQLSERIKKLTHLDLTHTPMNKPAPAAVEAERAGKNAAKPEVEPETEIAVPISLSAVIATQKRVQDTLGIFLPLSTFIARASELANDSLPLNKNMKPTSDDLFNSVLGLDRVTKSSRGNYVPQVTGLSPMPSLVAARPTKKPDIIDMLSTKQAEISEPQFVQSAPIGLAAGENIFSVTARTGEENRATEYLARMKIALEQEPGRLVL